MKRLHVYVDASVVGGCEDEEFSEVTLLMWRHFIDGTFVQVLSEHTLRELQGAPAKVRARIEEISAGNQILLPDSDESEDLAEAYLAHGAAARSSRADALHVALATIGRADVLVSWNFKHMVNLGRIRLFNAVNIALGYGPIEIRTPKEVLTDEEIL